MIVQNMLSDNAIMYAIYAHYNTAIIAPIFIGSMNGYLLIKKYLSTKMFLLINRIIIVVSVLAFIILEIRIFFPSKHIQESRKILKQIPNEVPVSASLHYFPHLHHRSQIYLFPELGNSSYIMIEGDDPYIPYVSDPYQIIKDFWRKGEKWKVIYILLRGQRLFSHREYNTLQNLIENPDYTLIDKGEKVVLFKRLNRNLN